MSMEYPALSFDAGAGVGAIGVPPMRESRASNGMGRGRSSPVWGSMGSLASPPTNIVSLPGLNVRRTASQSSVSSTSSNRSGLVPRPAPTAVRREAVSNKMHPRLSVRGIGGSSDPFWDPSDMLPPPVSPIPPNRAGGGAAAAGVGSGSGSGSQQQPAANPFLDPDPFGAAGPVPQSGLRRERSPSAVSWWRRSGTDESGVRVVSST